MAKTSASFAGPRKRQRLWALLCLLLVLMLATGYIALDRWQRALIFSVELGESRWWRPAPEGTEIFQLDVGWGNIVNAWYLPQPDPNAPAALYLHGSRWDLNSSTFRIERWHALGFSVLAIDYRGFGASTQRLPSQRSALHDARAALHELARRQPNPRRRFVYGHSLGAAIAAQLAASTNRPEFAGLVLEAPFTSVRDMLVTTQWNDIPGIQWAITQPFDTVAALQRTHEPWLTFHATADRVVPLDMATTFQALAAQRPDTAEVVIIEGASHSGASRHPEYRAALTDFVKRASNNKK